MTPAPGRADLRTPTSLAVLIAVTCAASAPARAGGDVGVIVTGEGSIQPQLAAQIADWLSRHGHNVIASPLPADAIPLLVDCFVMEKLACARNIVETRAKSNTVVYARVEAESNTDDGTRNVTLTAYWFAKGHDAIAERKTCSQCTARLLSRTADEVMKELVGTAGKVKFRSTPSGARIVIDGQPIGVTPLDWDLPPGTHKIQMDMPGMVPVIRDIVVASDRTQTLALALSPPEEQSALWSRHVPLGMVITGGAALVSGGVLFAIDEDDEYVERLTTSNTAPLGVGLAIGGALLAGAGSYLWFRSPRKTSTPVAVATRDVVYLGWSGRF